MGSPVFHDLSLASRDKLSDAGGGGTVSHFSSAAYSQPFIILVHHP